VPDENQPAPQITEREFGSARGRINVVMRDRTNQELMAEVKAHLQSWLRNIVVENETRVAEEAARAAVTAVDVT
jgi:hypothetical protein